MVEQPLNHRIVFFHVKKKDTKPQNGEAVHTPDPRSARTAEAKARCFRGPHAAAAAAAIAVSSDHHHKKRATHAAARCPFHDPKKKRPTPTHASPPLPFLRPRVHDQSGNRGTRPSISPPTSSSSSPPRLDRDWLRFVLSNRVRAWFLAGCVLWSGIVGFRGWLVCCLLALAPICSRSHGGVPEGFLRSFMDCW